MTPDLAPWIEFGKVFGFPAAVTAALLTIGVMVLMACYRAGRWIGNELAKPALQRAFQHADAIELLLGRVDKTTTEIKSNQPGTCRAVPVGPESPNLPPLPARPRPSTA